MRINIYLVDWIRIDLHQKENNRSHLLEIVRARLSDREDKLGATRVHRLDVLVDLLLQSDDMMLLPLIAVELLPN
jgi:hypothetical protein